MYWVKDLSLFANLTHSETLASIQELNDAKSPYHLTAADSIWHLATRAELEDLWNVTFTSDVYAPATQTYLRELLIRNQRQTSTPAFAGRGSQLPVLLCPNRLLGL